MKTTRARRVRRAALFEVSAVGVAATVITAGAGSAAAASMRTAWASFAARSWRASALQGLARTYTIRGTIAPAYLRRPCGRRLGW